ncbi:dynactin p62 family-domain-containing protein [Pyronema domesticum]|nr:dynactin p62 family-domain-containing protein [Pyronema domesticum]
MNAPLFPSILISCPCSDNVGQQRSRRSKTAAADPDLDQWEEEGETFDPRSPRSAFSLFPLENLLFCEDCNQVRCPRCVQDEIACYFCPSCLFEVPSSTVKSEGNRCTRNCFSCPICFAALAVTATGEDQTGPFILLCAHCLWSTSDIGITFEKPTSITAQLTAKLKAASLPPSNSLAPPESSHSRPLSPLSQGSSVYNFRPNSPIPPPAPTDEAEFARLKGYYHQQNTIASSDDFGGAGSLSRLMGMYSTGRRIGSYGTGNMPKLVKQKQEWQEIESYRVMDSEDEVIEKMKKAGFYGATSQSQRIIQSHQPRLLEDVRPLAALLRTKRAKRCRSCRHILVKPEQKVGSIRYRIRLVAGSYIPQLSISRLDHNAVNYFSLQPLATHQFLLTVTNPLYDVINITLATPEKTPGKYPATVYILCPEFEVGASTDVWDEALGPEAKPKAKAAKGRKTGLAGTIWDSGRNWTSVILEIVPPHLPDDVELEEDDFIVKVPILVRSVYESDVDKDDGIGKDIKEKKEHSYWSVLEVGRIGKKVAGKVGFDDSASAGTGVAVNKALPPTPSGEPREREHRDREHRSSSRSHRESAGAAR